MADVFLSYARVDNEVAEVLSEELESRGRTVWWDTRLDAGQIFDAVIEEEIEKAKCIVVLWTKTSIKSRWVQVEANEGVERGILVPVLVDDVKLPLLFRHIQNANIVGWEKMAVKDRFSEVFKGVSRILGPPVRISPSLKGVFDDGLHHIVQVRLYPISRGFDERMSVTESMVLDTGSDISVINAKYIKELESNLGEPLVYNFLQVIDVKGKTNFVKAFTLRVTSPVEGDDEVYDIGFIVGETSLLGLNFLKNFKICFDGPSKKFEISKPSQ